MAFDARNITEKHVAKAVEKIKSEKIDLINSTRWLVKINDQYYPPKEIMRYARQEYDGSDTWGYGGGPPTNKYLERMGFEISDKTEITSMGNNNANRRYWLYSPGEQAEFWEEFYEQGIMGLGWDYLGDLNQYSSKVEIVQKLQEIEEVTTSKKNDATANYEFKEIISVGDIIIAKKGREKLLGYGEVSSDYFYDNERKTFQKCRKVNWKKKGVWETGFHLVLKTLTDVTNYPADVPQYDFYYERLLGIINEKAIYSPPQKKLPLNQILYGPPGTGKTFKLQNEYFDQFTVNETSLTKSQYLENLVSDLSWWQVAAVVLLDQKRSKVNDIISHELVKSKAKLSIGKRIDSRIWVALQHYTVPECENVNVADRSPNAIFYKEENSYWIVKENLLEQFFPEAFSLLDEIKNYKPNPDNYIKNYEFVTFHQSFSYEDFVEGIKPKMEEQDSDLSYEIKDGIFKKLCLKATADPENQYAVFIDEINRGNVSSIFGELITLIEDDKRIGEENSLSVKLPYSKKEFGIPANLHIIGTMNTADRSVEALDTALRRRFTFEEVMPLPFLLKNILFIGFNLEEVLETVNKRIEALLDRDHTIGHSYFIKIQSGDTAALTEAFQNKIVPLLQEYFYHDYEKIALILGEGFVERKEGKVEFAKFKKLQDPEIIPSYEVMKEIGGVEAAVRKLLNRKDEATE